APPPHGPADRPPPIRPAAPGREEAPGGGQGLRAQRQAPPERLAGPCGPGPRLFRGREDEGSPGPGQAGPPAGAGRAQPQDPRDHDPEAHGRPGDRLRRSIEADRGETLAYHEVMPEVSPAPPPIAALVFDFDGTLVDTESPILTVWQEVYR